MKIQIILLLMISSIMLLWYINQKYKSFGGKFAIKEDLTIQIEINIFGFLLILLTMLCFHYVIDNGQSQSKRLQTYHSENNIGDISFSRDDENHNDQNQTEDLLEQESELQIQKIDEETHPLEIIHSILNHKTHKYQLDNEDHNQSQIDERNQEMEEFDMNFKKQRTMSLHLPHDQQEEENEENEGPKRQRKVSFNEKINTVHRYRKNSRKEKKNYESGEKEIKQIKRKVSCELEEQDYKPSMIIGRKKLKESKGLLQDKQNSKNKHFQCPKLESDINQVLIKDGEDNEDDVIVGSQE